MSALTFCTMLWEHFLLAGAVLNATQTLKLTTAMGTIEVNVLMGCFVTITDDLEGQTHWGASVLQLLWKAGEKSVHLIVITEHLKLQTHTVSRWGECHKIHAYIYAVSQEEFFTYIVICLCFHMHVIPKYICPLFPSHTGNVTACSGRDFCRRVLKIVKCTEKLKSLCVKWSLRTKMTLFRSSKSLRVCLKVSLSPFSQDENETSQGFLDLHGGTVCHFLPALLQGSPLRVPAEGAVCTLP